MNSENNQIMEDVDVDKKENDLREVQEILECISCECCW